MPIHTLSVCNRSLWPPLPLAWASTSLMCGLSSTTRYPRAWKGKLVVMLHQFGSVPASEVEVLPAGCPSKLLTFFSGFQAAASLGLSKSICCSLYIKMLQKHQVGHVIECAVWLLRQVQSYMFNFSCLCAGEPSRAHVVSLPH